MMKGKTSSDGTPKQMGLVPSMGWTPYVGAMEGRALVPKLFLESANNSKLEA